MYLVRLISSLDHPTMSAWALVQAIQQTGTDKYDPARKMLFTDFYEKHGVDFFASKIDRKPSKDDLRQLQQEFLEKSAGDRDESRRPDIAIIYDAAHCTMVEHVYEGQTESDCYKFKTTPLDALVEVVLIDAPQANRPLRKVPFYPNHEDNMHCMLAVYRSIFDYFLHLKMNWKEIESFTGYKPGRAAWTVKSLVQMQRMGFDIRMIEPFDYARFAQEGEPYVQEVFTKDQAEWQIKNTNLLDIRPLIPEFLEKVQYEMRQPTLEDIDAMLDERRLVSVVVNARVLNDEPGYVDHMILVIAKEDDTYIIHDPGGVPQPNRRISSEQLWKGMCEGGRASDVTGFKLQPGYEIKGMRLDQYVVHEFPALSRAYAAKLIENGAVLVNDEPQKPGYKLRDTDGISIDFDESELDVIPEIDLPVLYEDDDVVVVNKPAGVISHSRGKYWNEPSVASFIRSKLADNKSEYAAPAFRLENRAGIVHRLDRATSGVMICAKTPEALKFLQHQFSQRSLKKTYIAVVAGHLKTPEAIIDMPIERNPKEPSKFRVGSNGKPAKTHYRVTQESANHSLLELKPETGRTHQLRVHLKQVGHPIVGDILYGGEQAERLLLHAASLEITLPSGERKTFVAPLPGVFAEWMARS